MTQTFTERCKLATDCLPDADYRARLEALHGEMLQRIAELDGQAGVMFSVLRQASETLATIEPDDTDEAELLGELRWSIKKLIYPHDDLSLF